MEAGRRLGPYEIVAPIGAGGMGEVYRARDTRLDRTVAIKILPADFSQNPQLRMRFEREAKAISSLTHPHICTLHDVGSEEGVDYLVMEHLEGESLAERLARGPLTLVEVIRYGVEIAGALEKAHRAGIVHRDLKPGNVMLTKHGAKLLDFGLAKSGADLAPVDAATQQTIRKSLTEEGTILGTFQYMAPEQLEGAEVDHRADIFALGAMLYEMATGRRAFEGKSRASLIAAILATEPPPLSQIQPLTPAALERTIRLCLEKDPDERWQSAHDVKLELQGLSAGEAAAPARPASRFALVAGWIAAGLILLGAAAAFRMTRKPLEVQRVDIAPPEGKAFNVIDRPVVVSPDGRRLLVGFSNSPDHGFAMRPLDTFDFQLLNTNGWDAFWSPDGRQIGVFSEGKLRSIDVAGGSSKALASIGDSRGGSWGADGTILFAPTLYGPIMQIAANGGTPTPATRLDPAAKQTGHWRPFFLPDGRHFLFNAKSTDPELNGVYVAALGSPQSTRILDVDTTAIYEGGYLLYIDGDDLYAQRFDPKKLATSGDAFVVAKAVEFSRVYGAPGFSAADGVLAYHNRTTSTSPPLFRLDRQSHERKELAGLEGSNLDLARDDSRIAVQREDPKTHTSDIWVYDFKRGTNTRLSFDPAEDFGPVWSPDSRSLVYAGLRNGNFCILRRSAGGGPEEIIFSFTPADLERLKIAHMEVVDWSRDGRYLLVEAEAVGERMNLLTLDLERPTAPPARVIATPLNEESGRFSPNGRWIVYESDESGTPQLYVQPFPPTGAKWQISVDGGVSPRWRADSREIFYTLRERSVMAVEVHEEASGLVAGRPQAILDNGASDMTVTSDGKTFYGNSRADSSPNPIRIVMNWTAGLKR
jgi:Tol biopolymer transport system component/tRNA A-37 threonylcarbamoyl transferase component Bud32